MNFRRYFPGVVAFGWRGTHVASLGVCVEVSTLRDEPHTVGLNTFPTAMTRTFVADRVFSHPEVAFVFVNRVNVFLFLFFFCNICCAPYDLPELPHLHIPNALYLHTLGFARFPW